LPVNSEGLTPCAHNIPKIWWKETLPGHQNLKFCETAIEKLVPTGKRLTACGKISSRYIHASPLQPVRAPGFIGTRC
jgi:hypothetical protein